MLDLRILVECEFNMYICIYISLIFEDYILKLEYKGYLLKEVIIW